MGRPKKPAVIPEAHRQSPRGTPHGRTLKITPELTKAFCFQLRHGAHNETACAAVGISVPTFYQWMSQGKRGHQAFITFSQEVEKARAEVVQKLLERAQQRTLPVGEGGQGADPLPLLSVVDRRYSPQVRIQVTAELTVVLERIEAEFNGEPEILERILAAIAEDAGSKEIAYLAAGKNRVDEEDAEDAGTAQTVDAAADIPVTGRP